VKINKKKYSLKKAFSLIELSIVILIIGILVAGVTQSSRLINQMKLMTARSITLNSPVISIKDLYFWYETVMQKSFNETEASNNTQISTWFDNNPLNINDKIDLIQTDANRKPIYLDASINGLPGVYFNGVYFLKSISNVSPFFASGSATLFLVFVPDSANGQQFMVMYPIQNCAKNAEIGIGVANYASGNFGIHSGCGIGTITNGNLIIKSEPTIISLVFLKSPLTAGTLSNIKIYKNGGSEQVLIGSGGSYTSNMSGAYGITPVPLLIGLRDDNNNGGYNSGFTGKMGELIAFSRSLNDEERQSIEKYLAKKWALKIY
jgi:prepilin-type N-terminal cleavage/methylation domain-containing protein